MLEFISVIVDHPRCVIVDVSFVVKCGPDRMYSFADIVIFVLNCLSMPTFEGF